ncbi:MAG: YtxH domain-containing protein [Acidimicrobiia bacterium]
MRFRIGLVLGFAAGYYLGSKAGRERYEEIQRRLEALRDTRLFEKLQAAVELAVERLRAETEQPDLDLTREPVAPWEGSAA